MRTEWWALIVTSGWRINGGFQMGECVGNDECTLHYIYMFTFCFLSVLYLDYIVLVQDWSLIAACLFIYLAVLICCQFFVFCLCVPQRQNTIQFS